ETRFVDAVETEEAVDTPVVEAAEDDAPQAERGRGEQDVLCCVARLEQREPVRAQAVFEARAPEDGRQDQNGRRALDDLRVRRDGGRFGGVRDVPDLASQGVVVVDPRIETVDATDGDEELERVERAGRRRRAERGEHVPLVLLRHPVAGLEQRRELLERERRLREAPHRTAAAEDVGERNRRQLGWRKGVAHERAVPPHRACRACTERRALLELPHTAHLAHDGGRAQLRGFVQQLGRIRLVGVVAVDGGGDVDGRYPFGLAHGNGCGDGLTFSSASGSAVSPSSKAALSRRGPPRKRLSWRTSSGQSSGATTLATERPAAATSGLVT